MCEGHQVEFWRKTCARCVPGRSLSYSVGRLWSEPPAADCAPYPAPSAVLAKKGRAKGFAEKGGVVEGGISKSRVRCMCEAEGRSARFQIPMGTKGA
jgi:hypothetical protein